ncbi:PLP-dependent transferase [Punctularia strigosozonata HHB-11173 SS5]|uniref:PLP-dependent transferase n=1 Tax=Punctularia strigosozonata (strain HHB-11173) TaxID=741275 RepID=R7RZV3_PUNST|nr:PLP-dependent transferase [Punctularia strigosozonata HHB-11173 SS5]EIN03513.1 PLP-dependent transferase [Punctularia strigosozonata HHB-11173 SS5]
MTTGRKIEKIAGIIRNQYSEENPTGIVNCALAENTLMQEEYLKFFQSNLHLAGMDLTYGDTVGGSQRLFKALCRLFERYFNPAIPVRQEHIITGGGLGAMADQLVQLLCEPGDIILVARPYYNGFDDDVSERSQGVMYGVDVGNTDPAGAGSVAAFESALTKLSKEGRTVRAVMLCNPNNPLGFNYERGTIVEYCRFCEKHGIHLINDEIYALSQFGGESATPFTSILSIDVEKEAGCNPARVHMLYGMSKDFCANGLRVGAVVSQNRDLILAFYALARFVKVSSASDALWSSILLDDEKLDYFVTTNQDRLGAAYRYCCSWFESKGIPYQKASAGQYVFVNLNSFLRSENDEGVPLSTPLARDSDLHMDLVNAGIFIGLGSSFHHTECGWFRFTFSVMRAAMDVALDRFGQVLERRRKEKR